MRDGGHSQRSVLGGPLAGRGLAPYTGFYRSGCCDTGPDDHDTHGVRVEITGTVLAHSQSVSNDPGMPPLEFGFPGLEVGDRWRHRAAPRVVPWATTEAALLVVSLESQKKHALDLR